MDKVSEYVGIDVSKEYIDVYSKVTGHHKYPNNAMGFKELISTYSPSSWYVMEATGSYHVQLAIYLYDQRCSVSVVNPLVVKRFIQMHLRRTKTDKRDARMIALYGDQQRLTLWEPEPAHIDECKGLYTAIELYYKQNTALKNKLHSVNSRGITKGILCDSLQRQIHAVAKEIKCLEARIEELLQTNETKLLSNLRSIPGIGKKTAMLMIIATNGFCDFENYRQVVSYLGLAPMERRSGSSIRGHSYINKTGNPVVRNHLFMCSFTACECNPQCKALYERLVAKGKSKKLALIAVCNKLVRQACGIAKSGMPYDKNYVSMKN